MVYQRIVQVDMGKAGVPVRKENWKNESLTKIRQFAENLFGEKLESVILFGSYARGDSDAESDFDVMQDKATFEYWKETIPFYKNVTDEGVDFKKHSAVITHF